MENEAMVDIKLYIDEFGLPEDELKKQGKIKELEKQEKSKKGQMAMLEGAKFKKHVSTSPKAFDWFLAVLTAYEKALEEPRYYEDTQRQIEQAIGHTDALMKIMRNLPVTIRNEFRLLDVSPAKARPMIESHAPKQKTPSPGFEQRWADMQMGTVLDLLKQLKKRLEDFPLSGQGEPYYYRFAKAVCHVNKQVLGSQLYDLAVEVAAAFFPEENDIDPGTLGKSYKQSGRVFAYEQARDRKDMEQLLREATRNVEDGVHHSDE